MSTFRPYKVFSAHGENLSTLRALYKMYEDTEKNEHLVKPIVVFTAFSIEAYVNHLGSQYLGIWGEIERLPWKKKIAILYKVVSVEPQWGEEPLQFASSVFTLRDQLAHGKPELVYGPDCGTKDQALEKMREPNLYIPKWYRNVNENWVSESEKQFEALIAHLGELFGRGEMDRKTLAYTGVEEVAG